MIQFNLLPDVKLEYLKAERIRRLVVSISVLIALASLALFILMFSVTILQKKHINDLNKDIKTASNKLSNQKDVNKILTVQNQLNSLTGLHDAKPATSRLAGYLNQITPASVNINDLSIDFTQHTLAIIGTAGSLSDVNQYVDTLKFTTFGIEGEDAADSKAFSDVVLVSFGLQKEASYTVNLNYDEKIFDITKKIKLNVPAKVTTRSEVEKPTDLFKLPETTQPKGASR